MIKEDYTLLSIWFCSFSNVFCRHTHFCLVSLLFGIYIYIALCCGWLIPLPNSCPLYLFHRLGKCESQHPPESRASHITMYIMCVCVYVCVYMSRVCVALDLFGFAVALLWFMLFASLNLYAMASVLLVFYFSLSIWPGRVELCIWSVENTVFCLLIFCFEYFFGLLSPRPAHCAGEHQCEN